MDAKITPFPFHAAARNRALAKLYQAEAAVLQAGIRAEIDRGSSDEGDPWVVFVRPGTGEIIAHVAIIDGEVVADSPAFSRLMRGQDIKEILDRLVSRLKATGYDRPSATVTNLGIVAAAIALASYHLSDADAAWWSPIDPGAVAELTKDMSLVEAIAVITAARVVQELPTSWFAGGSDNNHPVEAPTIPETPEPTQPQHIEAPLQKLESAGEKIRFPEALSATERQAIAPNDTGKEAHAAPLQDNLGRDAKEPSPLPSSSEPPQTFVDSSTQPRTDDVVTSDPVADVPSSKKPDVSAPSDPESSTAVREYHATNDSIILIIERIKEENASWSVSNIFGLSGGDVAIVLANSEYDTLRLITEDGSAITIFAEDPSQVKPGLYPDFM